MIINYDLKAIFFHNPKCGGNTVQSILKQYNFFYECNEEHENYIDFLDDESYIKDIRDPHTIRKMGKYRYFYSHQDSNKEIMDNYFKFIYVRNPYTKILSAYMYLKRRLENDNNTIRGLEENPDYFEDFNIFIKNYKHVNNISFFHAFICQYEQLLDFSNNINFQYIAKTENLNEELINILTILDFNFINNDINFKKHNESKYEKEISEYYNEESFEFVNNFFEKDFEIFEYEKYNNFEEFKNKFLDISTNKTTINIDVISDENNCFQKLEIIEDVKIEKTFYELLNLYNNINCDDIQNKNIDIIQLIINEFKKISIYKTNDIIKVINNEINILFDLYNKNKKNNIMLLKKIMNSNCEFKKNKLKLNIKYCKKCGFKSYNELAYKSHIYFCK